MSYPILFGASRYPAIAGIAIAGLSIVNDTISRVGTYDYSTLGLGVMSDALTCTVTEERNGSYELEMTYPATGLHFDEMQLRDCLLVKPNYTDAPQLFRIYKISAALNGVVTINAQHISYDMSGFVVPGGLTASNLTTTISLLNQYSNMFTLATTKTGNATFSTDVPASVRSWLGGKEGSVLDLYGGEWHWNNFTATLSTARGANRGVTIRYAKNLTQLLQEKDGSAIYSMVRAYYHGSDDTLVQGNPISTGLSLDVVNELVIDASSHFGSGAPTVSQLDDFATDYINTHELRTPHVTIDLDFVQLQGLSERVDLCDTVTIEYEALGVSATAKCIETTWDCLKERYTSCTFGNQRSTLADTISTVAEVTAEENRSYLEAVIQQVTQLITGNLGGYVVMHDSDGDSYPDEILVMDTPDISTATKVWRWNKSGLGYSSTGYSGPYGLAMTADGQIVADFITAGTMSANHIKGGTLTLGGLSNTYGVLQILDASGTQIGKWDKDGATISGELEIKTPGYGSGYMITKEGSFSIQDRTGYIVGVSNEVTVYGLDTYSTGNTYNESLYLIPATSYATNGRTNSGIGSTGDLAIASNITPSSSYGYSGIQLGGGNGNGWAYMSAYNSSKYGIAFMMSSYGYYFDFKTTNSGGTYTGFRLTGGTTTNMSCTGTKSRLMSTEDYSSRLLYCYETPSPMFGDIGEGVIGDDGKCYVWIDPIFAETVDTTQYQVFLQKYGSGECWVSERKGNYFVVEGTEGLAFGWELKAKQIDVTQKRLDTIFDTDQEVINYGDLAVQHIYELQEGRISA